MLSTYLLNQTSSEETTNYLNDIRKIDKEVAKNVFRTVIPSGLAFDNGLAFIVTENQSKATIVEKI